MGIWDTWREMGDPFFMAGLIREILINQYEHV